MRAQVHLLVHITPELCESQEVNDSLYELHVSYGMGLPFASRDRRFRALVVAGIARFGLTKNYSANFDFR